MIAWAATLKELRNRIDAMINIMGENAPVSCLAETYNSIMEGKEYLDNVGVQIELVYINKENGQIVGDEANDYKPQENECAAVKLS